MMKDNEILQRDVRDALKWETQLNTAEIEVTAKNGIVTLTGIVDAPEKKAKAQNTAKQISGVLEILENIEVKINSWEQKNDIDIALKVDNNEVILEGTVDSLYQKELAEKTIWKAPGVWNIKNNLKVIHKHTEKKSVGFYKTTHTIQST